MPPLRLLLPLLFLLLFLLFSPSAASSLSSTHSSRHRALSSTTHSSRHSRHFRRSRRPTSYDDDDASDAPDDSPDDDSSPPNPSSPSLNDDDKFLVSGDDADMASDNPLDVPPAPQDLVRTCDRRGPMVNDRCIAACAAAAACMKVAGLRSAVAWPGNCGGYKVCAVLQLKPKPVPRDRGDVVINVETTKGTFEVTVKPSWSPRGAAQFLALARKGFYDGCSVFRVVRGFVAQFGISGDPVVQHKYALASIPDDPPKPGVSNRFGTLSFASHGANSRGTQVFFNLMNNARLDGMGFTPFAVVAPAKMGVPVAFNAQYGEKPDQGQLEARGRAYLDENFPGLDMITRVQVPPPGAGEAQMPTAVPPEGDDRMITHINGAMPDQAAPGSRSRSGSGSGSGLGSDWTSLEATYKRGAGSWAGSSGSRSGRGSRGGDEDDSNDDKAADDSNTGTTGVGEGMGEGGGSGGSGSGDGDGDGDGDGSFGQRSSSTTTVEDSSTLVVTVPSTGRVIHLDAAARKAYVAARAKEKGQAAKLSATEKKRGGGGDDAEEKGSSGERSSDDDGIPGIRPPPGTFDSHDDTPLKEEGRALGESAQDILARLRHRPSSSSRQSSWQRHSPRPHARSSKRRHFTQEDVDTIDWKVARTKGWDQQR